MTGGATSFKLGILALISLGALIAMAFVLGVHSSRVPTVRYHTYFDESVQGLETGSPVKFRGVSVGTVAAIDIAPDGRHVDVTLAIESTAVRRLDLDRPELRAELGTRGITGVKYVDVDFFASEADEALPFPPAPRHIRARLSLFKGLESGVDALLERAPRVLDRTLTALAKLDDILAAVDRADIPARAAAAIDGATAVAQQVRRLVARVDRADLPAAARGLLVRVDASLDRLDAAVDDVTGEHGMIAGVRRAADDVSAFGRRATASSEEVDRTLADIAEAAQALRDLLDEIERAPDMLVKGRARSKRP